MENRSDRSSIFWQKSQVNRSDRLKIPSRPQHLGHSPALRHLSNSLGSAGSSASQWSIASRFWAMLTSGDLLVQKKTSPCSPGLAINPVSLDELVSHLTLPHSQSIQRDNFSKVLEIQIAFAWQSLGTYVCIQDIPGMQKWAKETKPRKKVGFGSQAQGSVDAFPNWPRGGIRLLHCQHQYPPCPWTASCESALLGFLIAQRLDGVKELWAWENKDLHLGIVLLWEAARVHKGFAEENHCWSLQGFSSLLLKKLYSRKIPQNLYYEWNKIYYKHMAYGPISSSSSHSSHLNLFCPNISTAKLTVSNFCNSRVIAPKPLKSLLGSPANEEAKSCTKPFGSSLPQN